MPTPVSHSAVGFAIAAWAGPASSKRRVGLFAAACAALPDIDLIGWPLHLPDASLFSHRGITHSLVFALMGSLMATILYYRDRDLTQPRVRIAGILGLALVSHACLDALSTYSVGVQFLAPFSQQRFRFLWTPLGAAGLKGQLVQEAIVVLVPAVLLAWLGLKVRRGLTGI